ncbi:hypothetical protein D1007_34812 [Hordeum vulgare]|nr:hypothetical protein D1007_34812 [Hordeum vulgare]
MRWWRSRKFRLNADGVDVHCSVRGLHHFVRVQVQSNQSGKNPGWERRPHRHGRFTRSTKRPSIVATSGAMSKTWFTATENVPGASEPVKIAGVAVVADLRGVNPPPPRICGPDGPPVTVPRVKLSDGRHHTYAESKARNKDTRYMIVFSLGFTDSLHDTIRPSQVSPRAS